MYNLVVSKNSGATWIGFGVMSYEEAVKKGAKILSDFKNALVILKPYSKEVKNGQV